MGYRCPSNGRAHLEGTVQRAGGHVRIGVSLLKADGTLLWTESFDTQTTDVFVAQDTMAQQVASQLQLHLTDDQHTRLSKRSTSNPLAYDYYTRAVFSYDQRGRGPAAIPQNERTIELFKRALAADPNYAMAHAGLAHAYVGDSAGYQAAAAIREARAAQRLNPNLGQQELANFYNHVGLEDLAQREFQRALEIDPTSTILSNDYVSYCLLLHLPDETSAAVRKLFPEEPLPSFYYLMKGDLETAQRRIDEEAANGVNALTRMMTAYLRALKGDRKGSEELLVKLIDEIGDRKRATNYHHLTYDIASAYAINGNGPEAIKWLHETSDRGFRSYTLFARDPFLDNIRQLPEFEQFMSEMKAEYDQLRNEFAAGA